MQKVKNYSYDEYLAHQKGKKESKAGYAVYRSNLDYRVFRLRFACYAPFIGEAILCLGARLGTEVRALRDLGHTKAFGIDIGNYVTGSDLVVYGDFNRMDYSDNTFEFSYCNTLDHSFDLRKFFQEVSRVSKVGSYSVFDIIGDFDTNNFGEYIDKPYSFNEVENVLRTMGHEVLIKSKIHLPWKGMSFLIKWKAKADSNDKMKAVQTMGNLRKYRIFNEPMERIRIKLGLLLGIKNGLDVEDSKEGT